MRTVGIVCECNPFHDGHRRLLRAAREDGCDRIVCVLSDPFVQRGEPAILDARARAEALVRGGADAVVSLPFPYAAAGAEAFARAGVDILTRLGADELWFGSECGDLARLWAAAEVTATEAFQEAYACAAPTRGKAAAFLDTLTEMGVGAEGLSSNDLLGIAYLRALRELSSPMRPRTIRRTGSAYNATALEEDRLPSATALRRALLEGASPEGLSLLPKESQAVLLEACAANNAPAAWKHAERAVLATLRLLPAERIEQIAELSGGLGRRILRAAEEASDWEELLSLCANRTYTNARIRRGILFALCGVREEDLRRPPAWVRLLAANRCGCELLASRRRLDAIPVVTKAGDIPEDAASTEARELERRAYALWSLCLPDGRTGKEFLRLPPRILN